MSYAIGLLVNPLGWPVTNIRHSPHWRSTGEFRTVSRSDVVTSL